MFASYAPINGLDYVAPQEITVTAQDDTTKTYSIFVNNTGPSTIEAAPENVLLSSDGIVTWTRPSGSSTNNYKVNIYLNGTLYISTSITATDDNTLDIKPFCQDSGIYTVGVIALAVDLDSLDSSEVMARGNYVKTINNLASAAIEGTAAVGSTLQTIVKNTNDQTVSSSDLLYQWEVSVDGNVFTSISGAMSDTYTITPTDYNKYIRFTATGTTETSKGNVTSEAIFIGNKNSFTTSPSTLVATADNTNGGSVTLSWIGATPATDTYNIYRDNVKIGEVLGTTTTFNDTGLNFAATYEYYVEAVLDGYNNELSNKVTIIPFKKATNVNILGSTTISAKTASLFAAEVLPADASSINYIWSISPTSGVTITPNGSQVNIHADTYGSYVLTVKAYSPDGTFVENQSNITVQNNDATIHAFSINGVNGDIDDNVGTINVLLPSGTSLTATPRVSLGVGATYSPVGEVNFTNSSTTPVEYTVTTADGIQKSYFVTVTTADSKAVALDNPTNLSLTPDDPNADEIMASWDPVNNASSYTLILHKNDVPLVTLSNLIDTTVNLYTYIFDNDIGTYDFKVTAVGDGTNYINSEESIKSPSYELAITVDHATIDGSLSISSTLTGHGKRVENTNITNVTYQWQISSDSINYIDIAGETNATYTIKPTDFGKYIQVKVEGIHLEYGTAYATPSHITEMAAFSEELAIEGQEGNGQVTISWSPPSTPEPDNYQVYLDGSLYTTIAGNRNIYILSGLTNNTSYNIYLVAQKTGYTDETSNTLSLTPRADLTNISVTLDENFISLGESRNGNYSLIPAGVSIKSVTWSSNPAVLTILDNQNGTATIEGTQVGDYNIIVTATKFNGDTVADSAGLTVANTDTSINSVTINGVNGVFNNSDVYTFELPIGTDLTSLTPVFTLPSGATVSPAGPQDFSSGSVTYTVTAEDGSTKTYYLSATVNTEKTPYPTPTALSFDNGVAVWTQVGDLDGTYRLYLYKNGDLVETINIGNVASYDCNAAILANGESSYTFTVQKIASETSNFTDSNISDFSLLYEFSTTLLTVTISGGSMAGHTLVSEVKNKSDAVTTNVTYQWQTSINGDVYTDIPSENTATYTIQEADVYK